MHPLSFILRFTLWFAFFAIIFFILPPKRVYESYGNLFRSSANSTFTSMGEDGFTRFCAAKNTEAGCVPQDAVERVARLRKATEEADSLIVLGARSARGSYGFIRTSSQIVGYYPTALVLVLFLATPILWRRRLLLGLLALIPANLFIAFRIYIILRAEFTVPQVTESKLYAQYITTQFWAERLNELQSVLTREITASFVAAVFIWVTVLVLSGEAKRIRNLFNSSGSSAKAGATPIKPLR